MDCVSKCVPIYYQKILEPEVCRYSCMKIEKICHSLNIFASNTTVSPAYRLGPIFVLFFLEAKQKLFAFLVSDPTIEEETDRSEAKG